MSTAAPAFSILVVNYNAGIYLERCLHALRAQSLTDYETIVIDNNSNDTSLALSAQHFQDPRFKLVRMPSNTGFAAGNNRGAEIARGEWIVTLNPDAFPESGWLTALSKAAQRYPDVDMFGSTQINATDPSRLDGTGDAYFAIGIPWRSGYGHATSRALVEDYEAFGPCAAAAMYRADLFREVGGFDERLFCYVEDVDLAFRLRLAGSRCVQLRDAIVRHIGGASSDSIGAFARYHGTRNLIWVFVKNMPAAILWPMLPAHIAALLVLLSKAVCRGGGGVMSRAILDGMRGLPAIWRQRRKIQSTRRASIAQISRALCWNPNTYLRRDVHVIGSSIKAPRGNR